MEKKKRININESQTLVFKKIREYNDGLPLGKQTIKQQHGHTLSRTISLLADPANQSKQARLIDGQVWPTLKTNELALGNQLGQKKQQTIYDHFDRLTEAGFLAVSKSEKILKGEYTDCLLSISPDVIAYYG